MRLIRLALVFSVFLFACSREANYLERVVPPTRPQSPVVSPEPTVQPTPEPSPTAAPKKYSKNLEFKLANTTTTIPSVDILWVIDNSGSMGDEQKDIIDNTKVFIDSFTANSQLKWKMGVLSTGEKTDAQGAPISGQYPDPYIGFTPATLLDSNTPNPVPLFQDAVAQLGVKGSAIEHTFLPVLHNLKKYPDFLTKNSYLALIIVTDEDEGGERPAGTNADSFVKQLTQLRGGDKSKIIVYGAYETLGDCGQGFQYTFSRYWDLASKVTSTKYALCNPQFGKLLSSIGEDLITRVSTVDPVLLLDARPIPSSIKVTYKGQVLKSGFKDEGGYWIYDPIYNVIRVTNVAILDSGVLQVKVEFDIDPKY